HSPAVHAAIESCLRARHIMRNEDGAYLVASHQLAIEAALRREVDIGHSLLFRGRSSLNYLLCQSSFAQSLVQPLAEGDRNVDRLVIGQLEGHECVPGDVEMVRGT